MSEAEFQESLARGIHRHAAESVSRGVWTEEAALAASRTEFSQLLPQGRETPNRHFRTVIDLESIARIGETWYTVQEKGGKTQFWVDWVWIEPAHRRRGYATEVLRQLAVVAKRAGADRVGLHVLAENVEGRALYAKLGYDTTSLRMALPLGPPT